MKIYKFGGTSVGTVERMKHVAELISESTPKIVVLSATAGTTNHLEEIAANLFNRDIEQASNFIVFNNLTQQFPVTFILMRRNCINKKLSYTFFQT